MRIRTTLTLFGVLIGTAACATLQQYAALARVAFALDGVANGRLAGVDLSRVQRATSLSALEIGRITVAVARRDVPLEFTVNVAGTNPAENATTARMVRMDWTLLLDEKETISGVLDTTVVMPAGETTMIPLRMRLNLVEFFDGPAEDLLNLALSVAGLDSDPTRVTLRAEPTIDTPIGPIRYPQPVTIVSREVGGASTPE